MVRIVGNDIRGERKMVVGLTEIKGIGYMFANTILNILKIDPNQRIGYLSSEQIQSIESIIKNPAESNFPSWFLNRRKDVETGEDKHLITSDIAFTVRNDIEREKTSGSWRGIRHMFGLKVRGQRTRCTGRKGGAVGVAKGGKVMQKEHLQLVQKEHLQLVQKEQLKLKKVQERRKRLQLIKRNR